MKFDKYLPAERLRPYIRHFIISEQVDENSYKVFPSTGMVIGFQYKGRLSSIMENTETPLATSGITGISGSYKLFRNSADVGTVLVYFTETGFPFFSSVPAHELFDQSVAIDHFFDRSKIGETEEKLSLAQTDRQRINIVEQFLTGQLKEGHTDQLIMEAVRRIYASKGILRINELINELCISQSPFEKRFRKLVGTSPKKFASLVRFNAVLQNIGSSALLTELSYDHHFFDQAHFIKDFKRYTGETPEEYKRSL